MPFATADQVRTAIDNTELAIHRAIADGTIIRVMAAMRAEIVSSFPSSFVLHLLRTIKSGRTFPSQEGWTLHRRIQSKAAPL